MNFLFLFASLGVVNGTLVAFYLLIKRKTISKVYFGALILTWCLRIGKSIAHYFSQNTDKLILQILLSACVFIGPFFYLYLKSLRKGSQLSLTKDITLLIILLILVLVVGIIFPYRAFPSYWNAEIVPVIYGIWGIFILLGILELKQILQAELSSENRLKREKKH